MFVEDARLVNSALVIIDRPRSLVEVGRVQLALRAGRTRPQFLSRCTRDECMCVTRNVRPPFGEFCDT